MIQHGGDMLNHLSVHNTCYTNKGKVGVIGYILHQVYPIYIKIRLIFSNFAYFGHILQGHG